MKCIILVVQLARRKYQEIVIQNCGLGITMSNASKQKNRLFRRNKAGLVSFEYYNRYKISVTSTLNVNLMILSVILERLVSC